ncbi:MAG: hypothetical protein D4R44_05105 [Actinobacteria bacterium]|nr:MAG: hypothetical protein D4R44_05105 [Actinomycetota bacterium]
MSQTPAESRALSALPSRAARIIAFLAIVAAGLAGGSIGYALVDLQCAGQCAVGTGIGLLSGALIGALGMSIVAVLVLRAIGEWRELVDN